jgi:predicted phosphodiesterase
MHDRQIATTMLTRRAFVRDGSLFLLGSGAAFSPLAAIAGDESKRLARAGLVTDLHYADKPAAGTRHYRETVAKLAEAAERFIKDEPDFVVELGDFIDAADSVEVELGYLKRINKDFAALPGKKHYVLGNHCVDTLTKQEFLGGVEQKRSYYSFDQGGAHFVVLDACFRSDGEPYRRRNFEWTDPNIPPAQVEWLAADLAKAKGPAVVFVHQRLDVGAPYGVKNAPAVRKVLEDSSKVRAVFQGHSHKNEVKEIGGIHYCVLTAMVEGSGAENSGYATLDVFADGTMQVAGFRRQQDYEWK